VAHHGAKQTAAKPIVPRLNKRRLLIIKRISRSSMLFGRAILTPRRGSASKNDPSGVALAIYPLC